MKRFFIFIFICVMTISALTESKAITLRTTNGGAGRYYDISYTDFFFYTKERGRDGALGDCRPCTSGTCSNYETLTNYYNSHWVYVENIPIYCHATFKDEEQRLYYKEGLCEDICDMDKRRGSGYTYIYAIDGSAGTPDNRIPESSTCPTFKIYTDSEGTGVVFKGSACTVGNMIGYKACYACNNNTGVPFECVEECMFTSCKSGYLVRVMGDIYSTWSETHTSYGSDAYAGCSHGTNCIATGSVMSCISACPANQYGNGTTCTACPCMTDTGGVSRCGTSVSGSNTSITSCKMGLGYTFSDSVGNYTFTNDCIYSL